MAGGDDTSNNGRVTTREFYDALLKTNDKMDAMERRILERIDTMAERCPYVQQMKTNKEEIDKLRNRSNLLDGINGAFAVVAATLAALFGK